MEKTSLEECFNKMQSWQGSNFLMKICSKKAIIKMFSLKSFSVSRCFIAVLKQKERILSLSQMKP